MTKSSLRTTFVSTATAVALVTLSACSSEPDTTTFKDDFSDIHDEPDEISSGKKDEALTVTLECQKVPDSLTVPPDLKILLEDFYIHYFRTACYSLHVEQNEFVEPDFSNSVSALQFSLYEIVDANRGVFKKSIIDKIDNRSFVDGKLGLNTFDVLADVMIKVGAGFLVRPESVEDVDREYLIAFNKMLYSINSEKFDDLQNAARKQIDNDHGDMSNILDLGKTQKAPDYEPPPIIMPEYCASRAPEIENCARDASLKFLTLSLSYTV